MQHDQLWLDHWVNSSVPESQWLQQICRDYHEQNKGAGQQRNNLKNISIFRAIR